MAATFPRINLKALFHRLGNNESGLEFCNYFNDIGCRYQTDTSIPTTDSKSLDNEGNNLLSQGKYEQAIPYFDRILDMNTSDSGLMVEVSKNKQLAIDTLKNAVNHLSNN